MGNSDFIGGLVATAEPVTPRRVHVEVLALAAVALVQLVGVSFYFGTDKVAMALGGGTPMLTKLVVFGGMAIGMTGLALWSLAPATRHLSTIAAIGLGAATVVGLAGLEWSVGSSVQGTIYPQYGVRCFFSILSLSMPVTLLLSLFMARGASTQPRTTALMIGLAGGSWGAFAYAVQCPFVSVWYLGVWYVGGVAMVSAVAAVLLPRFARW